MKKQNKKKKILIAVTAIVLAAAVGAGVFLAVPGTVEPVGVYPFEYLGMTEYWGDNQESYGPVTSDNIQTVFLTDTQIVTEIKVKAGDTVKKGDVLMTFDTTLSSLSLERKRLDMEKKKLNLEIAQRELGDILMLEPMEEPAYTEPEEEEPNLGREWNTDDVIPNEEFYENDGSSKEKALICWLKDGIGLNDDLLEKLGKQAAVFQQRNRVHSNASDIPATVSELTDSIDVEEESKPSESTEETDPAESTETTDPTESTEETNPTEPTEETDPTDPTEETDPTESTEETGPTESTEETDPTESTEETDPTDPTEETDFTEPTEETEPEEPAFPVNGFYVVFKVTQDNMSNGTRLVWQGMFVSGNSENGFSIRLFNADDVVDYTYVMEEAETETQPYIDFGSGYTLAQIVQMRNAKQKEIKQLEFDLKMVETEYKIMQNELEDGNVYAAVDGDVVSVLTEEEARQTRQPIIKVSGGGGFYVQCSVSELEKEKMEIGMEVTVNDWNTGMTYTGTVDSLGDFPSADGYWNGMGNPNTTYYPFTVFVDGSADLQTQSYVSVMYSTASTEHGIYLENPFIRTEQGKSYVYVLGAGNKLEKREVVTGKSLWGSYTEVLSGITEEDLIAFPYGKNVKAGAPAEERDISELYSY